MEQLVYTKKYVEEMEHLRSNFDVLKSANEHWEGMNNDSIPEIYTRYGSMNKHLMDKRDKKGYVRTR